MSKKYTVNQVFMSLSTYYLEGDCHLARLHRRRCCHAYAPTSNTASHDNHKKINSWVSFSFLYGYGALLGGPLGQLELCYNLGNSKHFVLLRFNLDIGRNSLRYRGPLAWELTPTSLKQSPSRKNFKNLLKQSCHRNFIKNISFPKEVCMVSYRNQDYSYF